MLKKRNILFVIGSLEVGGAEGQLVQLTSRIQQRHKNFCSCHVFTLQKGGALRQNLFLSDVPVYSGGMEKGDMRKAPWKLVFAQWRLIRVIREIRPDVIHAFLPLVTFMGAFAGRLNGVRLVITSRRALGTHQKRFPILLPFDLVADLLSHVVTVNSRAVLEDALCRDHVKYSKMVLIYNGIDPAPFQAARANRKMTRATLGLKPCEKSIIVIANFISYKGHLDFIKSARLVIDQIPTAKFLLIGEDRGMQMEIRDRIAKIGISRNVLFAGRRFDIPDLLAASDISVLPSHEEGFSNVILESMAAGLPVIATRVGGNPEAVLDGVTGWLVPPRDPLTMAQKMIDLLHDPEKASAWGERGRQRVVKHFGIDMMVKRHLRLYDRLGGRQ